jgi:hypothetical protein
MKLIMDVWKYDHKRLMPAETNSLRYKASVGLNLQGIAQLNEAQCPKRTDLLNIGWQSRSGGFSYRLE